MVHEDAGPFAALADYDGYEIVFDDGYFAKFVFKSSESRTSGHGYRYSLTLHAPSGERLLGFDNAHSVKRRSARFRRRTTSPDHWHRDASDKGRPYDFHSPGTLLEDFFTEVERTLKSLGIDSNPRQIRATK